MIRLKNVGVTFPNGMRRQWYPKGNRRFQEG